MFPPAALPNPLTMGWTPSPLGSTPEGWRMASQLTQGPVTSGGCRERVSVTSGCTHPLPLPSGLGTRAGPSFPGPQAQPGLALTSVEPSAAGSCCPRSPRTIVGKSRTTGSHYLTSVSSTIAKHGGRKWQQWTWEVAACAEKETGTVSTVLGGPGRASSPQPGQGPGMGAPSPQSLCREGGTPREDAPTRSQGTLEGTSTPGSPLSAWLRSAHHQAPMPRSHLI